MAVRVRALVGMLACTALLSGVAAVPAGAVVVPVNPVAVRPLVATLTVTTTALPSGTAGVPYKAVLTASGGTAPYVWTALKPLPAGINLNSTTGVLDGVPRDASTTVLLFSVSDAAKKAAQSPSLPLNIYKIAYKSGQLFSWGDNSSGELGNGTTVQLHSPGFVSGMTGVIQTAASDGNGYALTGDGKVWAWGGDAFGELGQDTTVPNAKPRQIVGLSGVIRIAAAAYESVFAVRSDGTVWDWGSNEFGQLGNNSLADSAVPAPVPGLTSVVAIAAGYQTAMAVRSDGTVWMWGSDNVDGTNAVPTVPVQVPAISNAVAAAEGERTYYVLRSDGTVWAWGDNLRGQLGNGSSVNSSSTPVQVSGLTSVRSIAAAAGTGYALRTDGTVMAWGEGFEGELGHGLAERTSTPVQVGALSGVTTIGAGGNFAFARRNDGTLWSWGYNYYGQLGVGTTAIAYVPAQITTLSGVAGVGSGPGSWSAYAFIS